jgi:rsbT co-antagonist protein RsbR
MPRISALLEQKQSDVLNAWLQELRSSGLRRDDLMREGELREQCSRLLELLAAATHGSSALDVQDQALQPVREHLTAISRTRTGQGFTPREVASFVLSLKRPLFAELRRSGQSADAVLDEAWGMVELLDQLALYTTDVFQKAREEIIHRQQEELMELSTPVVNLWEGIVALPLIGTLDSARTQVVLETLLNRIVETGARIAIIDITGVPTVDTMVAQHLLKTVAAARLMGADCIISGIRPQIAQTIVHLAIDLRDVTTRSTLADAFAEAVRRSGAPLPAAGGRNAP